MNNKSSIISSLLVIMMATSSYADNVRCPSIDDVRAASFVQGFEFGDEWLVISNTISSTNSASWTVGAGFKNAHVVDSDGAIDFVNNTIKTINMVYPEPMDRGDGHECWYVDSSLMTVIAFDRPLMFPQLKFAK